MVSTIGRLQSDDFDCYWYLLTSVETFFKSKTSADLAYYLRLCGHDGSS